MLPISLMIAFFSTALTWPLVRGWLGALHERSEQRIRDADPEARAALEFNQPPKWMRTGIMGSLVQCGLIFILYTVGAFLLLSRL